MSETVCAVVVTYNRKLLLASCLNALLTQSRPLDQILVVNNASTDGTGGFLAEEFPDLKVLQMAGNLGGAGGFHAGLQWGYAQGFDWFWVMDDDVEPFPGALEALLRYQDIGDLIQGRKMDGGTPFVWESVWDASSCTTITCTNDLAFQHGKQWTSISYANFEGALIKRKVVDAIGLPDPRYFIALDDTIYGFLAALHCRVIYVNVFSMLKKTQRASCRSRFYYYFSLRNRFLSFEHLQKAGVPVRRKVFLVQTLIAAFSLLSEIVQKRQERNFPNARTVFAALLDGYAGRFGRPPWIS